MATKKRNTTGKPNTSSIKNVSSNIGTKTNPDVDYAKSNIDKNAISSEAASGKEVNILDDFFRGIDRSGGAMQRAYESVPEFNGYSVSTEEILNSEGITLSRLTSKVLNTTRVNINHAPSQVDFTNFGKMYVFFTKPDLYLFTDSSYTVNPSIKDNDEDLFIKINRNLAVASGLQIGTGVTPSYGSSGGLNYLLGNLCNEIEVPDVAMSVTPGPKNAKNTGISYVGDFTESLAEGTISISFIDTRDRDVITQLEIWSMYMEGERKGTIFKKPDYIGKNVIDYACTIFIFAVDETNNIQGMIKLVGCFPISMNTELVKYRATQLNANDFIGPFTWTFHVSYVSRPNVHEVAVAFNYCSGYGDKVLKNLPNQFLNNPHKAMYKKTGDYWHHTGMTMDHGTITEYPYHFTLEDKWAELPGINMSTQSSGVVNYTLGFASRNVGTPMKPEDFWHGSELPDTGSRWQDGTREYVNPVTGEKEIIPATSDNSKVNSTAAAYNYGTLDYTAIHEPISLTTYNGGKGTYQGEWEKWNTGNQRYGTSVSPTASDNSNIFRNAMRGLSGYFPRKK